MLEQLEIPGVLDPSSFWDSAVKDASQKSSVSGMETVFINKYYDLYISGYI